MKQTRNRVHKLVLRLRTKDDLMEILSNSQSPAWIISKEKEKLIQKVQIFNWDGTFMLEASFDSSISQRRDDGRLIVGFMAQDAHIVRCNPPLKWLGQNPVHYFDEFSENTNYKTVKYSQPNRLKSDNVDDYKIMLQKLIENQYNESIEILDYFRVEEPRNIIFGHFLELHRHWFFDFQIELEKPSISYRVNELIRCSSEKITSEIFPQFGQEELNLLYNLILLKEVQGGEVKILTEDEFSDEEKAWQDYGFYPMIGYPVIVYRHQKLHVNAGFYTFMDTQDKPTLSEQVIVDKPQDSIQVFSDCLKAFNYLVQHLNYYREEQ